eukprot:jgi/Tetstr1/465661/TSEL_010307.t1
MHNGGPLALDVSDSSVLAPRKWNRPSSPSCRSSTRITNIASAAKTSVRLRFGGGKRRNDHDCDGSGNNRDYFKTTRPTREAAAARTAKDTAKDIGKGKTKVAG